MKDPDNEEKWQLNSEDRGCHRTDSSLILRHTTQETSIVIRWNQLAGILFMPIQSAPKTKINKNPHLNDITPPNHTTKL